MPAQYLPDVLVDRIDPLWDTILLSQRDVSQDIPINFADVPGIALTAACFSDKKYTTDKATCISNLLAYGYRLFLVDFYWSPSNGWTLCPVSSPHPDYQCSSGANPSFIFSLFSDWIQRTEYNTLASAAFLVMSLHDDLSSPPAQGPGLKAPGMISALPDFPNRIYSPVELRKDREDLNITWLHGGDEGDDEARYFVVEERPDGGLSSKDAWPSESYLAYDANERLLLAFGDISVAGFDPAKDGGYIFQPEDMGWPYSSAGNGKCFFDPSVTSVKDINNNWAQMTDTQNDPFTERSILNETYCGYSPVINSTVEIGNLSIPQIKYFELLKAMVWTWSPGEPAAPPPDLGVSEREMFRCASMKLDDGRWKVTDCNTVLYPACRVNDRPYQWEIGDRAARYFEARHFCPRNSKFDVPRTALESQYLLSVMKSKLPQGEKQIWLDFQSLARTGCWVSGGEDTTCPYGESDIGNKTIIVPTVAAIIVLIIAGLMVFAKLGNRRMEKVRKRRRKMVRKAGEYEYEGVPA
ncbi:hypothetical protein BDZ91DRAFT_787597 [Kalaharituber pfeilii]|nr:hypothetical protein BDZ91DRAFT_787597 [Kalaharituber pfeilii]